MFIKKRKTVNSTSPSLPEKHLESEQLFKNCDCDTFFMSFLNPRSRRHEENKVTQRYEGGRGGQSPSIFISIQPIDMKLGMCNKCPIYFQLSMVTWHLIGFHGNHSNIMTSLVANILDFQIFNFFLYSNLSTENSKKTTFSDWNLQNCKINCKVISI